MIYHVLTASAAINYRLILALFIVYQLQDCIQKITMLYRKNTSKYCFFCSSLNIVISHLVIL